MPETAAEKAARKAARFSAQASESPPAETERDDLDQAAADARRARTVRTKRIRRTVDLPPARHHRLTEWCQDEAMTLGVARVSGQDVINELVHLLLTDKRTEQMIHDALADALAAEGK